MYDHEVGTHPFRSPVLQSSRRSEDVNASQQNVDRYKEALNTRQAALRRREAAMEEREALNRRNAVILKKDRDARVIITVMQRHRVELDDLLARQREELDRLVTAHGL